MYKVLFIDDRTEKINLYAINFKVYINCELDNVLDLNSALKDLQSKDYDMVICRGQINGMPIALKIHEHIVENKLFIPLIILGSEPLLKDEAHILDENPRLKELLKNSAQILGITATQMASQKVDDYFKIEGQLLKKFEKAPVSIYLQAADKSFASHISKLAQIDKNNIQTSLYIKSEDRINFIKALNLLFLNDLNISKKDMGIEEKSQIMDQASLFVAEQLTEFGVNEETINLTNNCIQSMGELALTASKIKGLVLDLLSDKLSFRYRNMQMISIFAHSIIRHIEWGTKEQADKITSAAFLHDVTLNSDKLARILTLEEFKESKLSDVEENQVLNHAALAAELAVNMPKFPLGSDQIILQHHGSPSGKGFLYRYSNLAPLSKLFIILEAFSHKIIKTYEVDKKVQPEKILDEIRQRFPQAQFRVFVKALEKMSMTTLNPPGT